MAGTLPVHALRGHGHAEGHEGRARRVRHAGRRVTAARAHGPVPAVRAGEPDRRPGRRATAGAHVRRGPRDRAHRARTPPRRRVGHARAQGRGPVRQQVGPRPKTWRDGRLDRFVPGPVTSGTRPLVHALGYRRQALRMAVPVLARPVPGTGPLPCGGQRTRRHLLRPARHGTGPRPRASHAPTRHGGRTPGDSYERERLAWAWWQAELTWMRSPAGTAKRRPRCAPPAGPSGPFPPMPRRRDGKVSWRQARIAARSNAESGFRGYNDRSASADGKRNQI